MNLGKGKAVADLECEQTPEAIMLSTMTDEGDGDLDGDGIRNKLDLDSDGDGCNDVIEAGFTDGDDDGLVGSGTPTVDETGKVEGHSYDTPQDKDSDGTKDFLQVSNQAVVTSHPIDVIRQGGDDAEFSATFTGDATITYQWQYSDDDTLTWTDLEEGGTYSGVTTNTLKLTAVSRAWMENINDWCISRQL